MKTTNHTPGPWRFHLGRGASPRIHIQTSGGYQIVSTTEVSRHAPEAIEQRANARLIAAAPDLLAALELALKCADDHGADHFGFGEYADAARAAIAKAKEGQP